MVIWWVSPAEHLPPWQMTPSLIWQTAVYFWSVLRGFFGVEIERIILSSFESEAEEQNALASLCQHKQTTAVFMQLFCLAYKLSLASTQPLKCCASHHAKGKSHCSIRGICNRSSSRRSSDHHSSNQPNDNNHGIQVAFKWCRLKAFCCHMQYSSVTNLSCRL